MSEKFITRERVFFTASALALGAVTFKLIQRHREQEDDITLEGADQKLAEQFGACTVPLSSEPIDSDIAYVGIEDDEYRAATASEVHAIGEPGKFARLRRLAVNGAVHLYDKARGES